MVMEEESDPVLLIMKINEAVYKWLRREIYSGPRLQEEALQIVKTIDP